MVVSPSGASPLDRVVLSCETGYHRPAAEALAASPTLARRLDFATAWDEAVAALPGCGHITLGWHHTLSHERGEAVWFAEGHGDCWDNVYGYGPTPTDALVALAEALLERAR